MGNINNVDHIVANSNYTKNFKNNGPELLPNNGLHLQPLSICGFKLQNICPYYVYLKGFISAFCTKVSNSLIHL